MRRTGMAGRLTRHTSKRPKQRDHVEGGKKEVLVVCRNSPTFRLPRRSPQPLRPARPPPVRHVSCQRMFAVACPSPPFSRRWAAGRRAEPGAAGSKWSVPARLFDADADSAGSRPSSRPRPPASCLLTSCLPCLPSCSPPALLPVPSPDVVRLGSHAAFLLRTPPARVTPV